MSCLICSADEETANQVWYSYAHRLRMRDALSTAQKTIDEELTYDQVAEHLRTHEYIQPSPPGKGLNRSLALQEALTSFPPYWFYLMLALYRAQALSEQQLYKMFYLEQAKDSAALIEQMRSDLQRLSSRSFLYRVWPESLAHTLKFEDAGPYYFLNRQAIPLVERLEGLPGESLSFGAYVTSAAQVQEFYLERDARFLEVIVALRSGLYRREVELEGKSAIAHLAIENWFAPIQLHCEIAEGEPFSPAALIGIRCEAPDGSWSHLLPCWFEYDRGTDEASEVADEIFRYSRYYGSEHYRNQFPILALHSCPGPLIVVCEDAYRREEVREQLAAKLGDQEIPVYLVERSSLTHDPYGAGILLRPGDEDGRYSLLEVMFEHSKRLREAHALPGTAHLDDPAGSTPSAKANPESQRIEVEGWG